MQFVTAGGAALPILGFGTYGMTRPDMLRMIPAALKAGFRRRGCLCPARDSAFDFMLRGVARFCHANHAAASEQSCSDGSRRC